MKQRYSLTSNAVKFRLLTLTLLTLFIGSAHTAWGWGETVQVPRIYEIQSTETPSTDGLGTYKFKYRYSDDNGTTWVNWSSETNYIEQFIVNCPNATDEVKIIFNTSHPVSFRNNNGSGGSNNNKPGFAVRKGILIMELGPSYTSTVTLKRTSGFSNNQNGSCPFFLGMNANGGQDGGPAEQRKLIIRGNDPTMEEVTTAASPYSGDGYLPTSVKQDTCTFLNTRQFVIDGGYTFNNISWDDEGTLTVTGSGSQSQIPFFRVQTGTLELTNVTIQNSRHSAGHGAVYIMTNNTGVSDEVTKNVTVKMTHCLIHNICGANATSLYPGVGIQFTPGKDKGTGIV